MLETCPVILFSIDVNSNQQKLCNELYLNQEKVFVHESMGIHALRVLILQLVD